MKKLHRTTAHLIMAVAALTLAASVQAQSSSYVARVRTASGRVYEIDRVAVLEQIRKVARKITEADLEPKRDSLSQQ